MMVTMNGKTLTTMKTINLTISHSLMEEKREKSDPYRHALSHPADTT